MKKITADAEYRNNYGHRTFPNGDTMWDEECRNCTSRRMTDDLENLLGIRPEHLRITLNVEKLRYALKQVLREATTPPLKENL